ncbi:hypothetical protein DUNSADRAFT_4532 [Dunaliella salina]|uniref:Cyclic nucleotide-binding domain-containing protein n=1 Tax=Dunaliella salina TaxID=3046 RepID=A0ABQ7GRT4_DUNSA|nr:hypothetical protein DUNSADRAFT_4532 [Dunaliella salina]|eukprot:KAF5837324.1 hypothetical protein DUNSADRAFT_4532 [Dunaliella salina]
MSAPHEVPGPPDQPEPVPCSQALHAVQTDQAQPGGVACYQFGNEAGAMLQHSALIAGEQLSQAEESQRRRNGRSSRRCMNAKGQHITGSGQLPVLDTYLSELSDAREPSAVTQSLAEGLYKHHEPPQLPHRIQSFYLGPEARQPDLYSSTGFLRRPASAGSSSSTLPHLHTAPSPYAHVKPRIWSSRAGGGSPQQLRHSQLLYGSPSPSKYSFWSPYSSHSSTDPDSSTAEPSLCTSAPQLTQASPPQHQQRRSSPPRSSLPRPPRLGDPLSKSIAAELQQQDGVLLRTTPQAAQLTHAHFRQQQQPPGPQVADSQVSLKSSSPPPTDKVAHAILYGPPLTSHPSLEPLKTGTSRDSKAAPFITTSPTTAGGVSAGIQPMPASASHQATQHKVQRFVADVGRVMGRLQHAATRSNSGGLEEGWGPEGKGPGVDAKTEGLARVMQWQKAAVAARQRQQRSLFVPLYTRVQLPPSLQGVTSASGKSGGAKLLRNLYEREGHTKSTIRKMLDQLPQLNRLESPLLQALSDKFVPYSYPPNSLMVAQGTACEEVFVLLSGQVLILPRAQGTKAGGAAVPKSPIGHQPQPVCVQPGAVLGVDHMLQRLQGLCLE